MISKNNKRVSVTIPKDVYEEILKIAKQLNMTFSKTLLILLNGICVEMLEKADKKN